MTGRAGRRGDRDGDRTQPVDRARAEARGDDRAVARHETPAERLDRNWGELLQELRVVQTGVQILTGFLLTLPFQGRFTDLDTYQHRVYLVLVVLAVMTTALIVAPVSLHRVMFRKHLKAEVVDSGDRLARAGLISLALTLAGAGLLVFDVVLGRTAGWVAGGGMLALLVVFWLVVPVRQRRVNEARSD